MKNQSKNSFLSSIADYFNIDRYDFIKIIFLGFSYFFILASYSILKPLKTSIFLGLVGKDYQPYTRLISICVIIPYMFLYSKMIDTLKRRHVVGIILTVYGIISMLFALMFLHPVHGLQNTFTGPYRLMGWAFEIFMDLYSALIISVFWSFVNSICTPDFAKKYYGFIAGTGKVGGILSPLFALSLSYIMIDSQTTSLLSLLAGLFLIIAVILVFKLLKRLPHSYIEGYQETITHNHREQKTKPGMFEGLKLMASEPYVFGIFWLMYSVEIISIIFDYQMQVLLSNATNNNIGQMSKFMFIYTSTFQSLGFVFAFFGTSTLLSRLGIRSCMMIMPVTIIGLTTMLTFNPNLSMVFIIMVILRALNYGFDFPIREMLYIPTIKDIQFKSKAWSDSFGKTLSKTSGSVFNLFSIAQRTSLTPYFYMNITTLGITATYLVTAFFVGRKYVHTIADGKIIGEKNKLH